MKETLQEFIDKTIDESFEIELASSKIEKYIKLGAKWQAERSYNENEVFMILESYRNWDATNFHQGEWFEQFKK